MQDLLENLNKKQLEAVTHTGYPLLIVAGAGTGKTTVITRKIAWILQQGLARPDEILALTFTDKAAKEMEERLDVLLPLGSFDMWISTFHGFCQRILESHALDVGLPNDFHLISETRQWMLLYRNFDRLKLDYYKPIGSPYRFVDALLRHFSRCKDEMISPADYLKYAEDLKLNLDNPDFVKSSGLDDVAMEIKRVSELALAFDTYQQILLEEDFLDFGDLINYSIKLFYDRPNILKYYQKKFKFILVDEFQDTNLAQYELVKLLAQREVLSAKLSVASGNQKSKIKNQKQIPNQDKHSKQKTEELNSGLIGTDHSALSTGNNLTVVGDDDQAIYKFRGASVSNILKFKEDFSNLTEVTLTENYRSSQEILDLAYAFIRHNDPNRLEVKLGIDKKLINPTGKTKKSKKEDTHIKVLQGKDVAEEMQLVVKNILKLKEENSELTWNDFAILFRSNSASRDILPYLENAGIPFTYLSNTGLYQKPLIFQLLNYLKLLDNYHESSALYRVLNFPKFQMPAEAVARATQWATKKTLSLYETLKEPEFLAGVEQKTRETARILLETLHKHTEIAKEKTIAEVFVKVVADLEIGKILTEESLESAQSRQFLEQFYKKILTYEQENPDRTLKGFMEHMALMERAGDAGRIDFDPESGPESLKVMTVHSSKGLEFTAVFLIGLVEQRFPSRAKKEAIEIPESLIKDILPEGDFHLQEERRLFYVGLTRAKKHLFLSWSSDYGGARSKKPSQFLGEAGLVLQEKNKAKAPTGKVVFETSSKKPSKEVYKVLPTSFSYSAVKAFLQCPLEYKYSYYLKLPLPGSPYFSFGQTVHKVFEKYLVEYKKRLEEPAVDLFGKRDESVFLPDISYLKKLYEEHWLDEWYENKSQKLEYRKKGEKLLEIFYAEMAKQAVKPKYIEKFFKLQMGGFDFVGKIDRADETPRGLRIIDYKTGKPPGKKSEEDLNQLKIYQLAVRDFLREKTASLAFWYVEDDKWQEIEPATVQELEDLEVHLVETMEKITEAVKFDLFAKMHHNHIGCKFEGWE